MTQTPRSGYYTDRQAHLLSGFDREARHWQPVLAECYGPELTCAVLSEALARYAPLIPELPYIGGDENHLTGSLVDSARCLALYLAMKTRGHTAADTGRVLYDAVLARADEPRPESRLPNA